MKDKRKNNGGAGRGQGRKPSRLSLPRTVRFDPVVFRELEELPGSNSENVDEAVRRHLNTKGTN